MRLEVVTGMSKDFFQPNLRKKFDLEQYNPRTDLNRPLLVFGCGAPALKKLVMSHQGFCVILWTGSDTLKLHAFPPFLEFCKNNTSRVFHMTYSHWCKVDLDHWGIPYTERLIVPTDITKFNFEKQTDGDIYHYGNKNRIWYYGTTMVEKIEERWLKDTQKPGFSYATFWSYSPEELYQVYTEALLGVRLTEHDGIAGSVIEMGLMGRRTIYNGDHPSAIHYSPNPYTKYTPEVAERWVYQDETIINRVMELIVDELTNRPQPDKLLAEEMKEYVHDDLKWLDTKYYT